MNADQPRHGIHVVRPNTVLNTLKIRATVAQNPDGTVTLESAAHYIVDALYTMAEHMDEQDFQGLLRGLSLSIVPPSDPNVAAP